MQTRRWPAHAGSRLKLDAVLGRPRLKGQPSSRTGENSPYGMIGGIEETSASFEARSAPRSYPTGSVLLHCMSPKVAHHDDLCTAALHPLIGGKPTKPSPDRVEKIRDGESPAMSTSPTACGARPRRSCAL